MAGLSWFSLTHPQLCVLPTRSQLWVLLILSTIFPYDFNQIILVVTHPNFKMFLQSFVADKWFTSFLVGRKFNKLLHLGRMWQTTCFFNFVWWTCWHHANNFNQQKKIINHKDSLKNTASSRSSIHPSIFYATWSRLWFIFIHVLTSMGVSDPEGQSKRTVDDYSWQ